MASKRKMKLIEEIWSSEATNKTISSVAKQFRDDMKQHLAIILIKMDYTKLKKLHTNNEIDKYIWGIVKTQWQKGKAASGNKPTSSFWKEHTILDDGHRVNVEAYDFEVSEYNNLGDLIDKHLSEILDNYHKMNINSINYFFNRTLFELYYVKGLTYQQIVKETGINYTTVRKSIMTTLEYVKKEMIKYVDE